LACGDLPLQTGQQGDFWHAIGFSKALFALLIAASVAALPDGNMGCCHLSSI
jgi:hypothetical protein